MNARFFIVALLVFSTPLSCGPNTPKPDVVDDINEEETSPPIDGSHLPDSGCRICHQGIEDAHPKAELSCTDCHGGDGLATVKEDAHVPLSAPSRDIRKMATDELDTLPHEQLLFINPGDLRVAERGCGAGPPSS